MDKRESILLILIFSYAIFSCLIVGCDDQVGKENQQQTAHEHETDSERDTDFRDIDTLNEFPSDSDSQGDTDGTDTGLEMSPEQQQACITENCMETIAACMGDEQCSGWMDCIQGCGDDTMACPTFCGMYYFSPLANEFTECALKNGCYVIDFSSHDQCFVPERELGNLEGLDGTWWFVASSGEDHIFDPECQRFDFETAEEGVLHVDFSVPLTDNGIKKISGTPGSFVEEQDGSIRVVYDNYAAYYEKWYIVYKSENTLLAHLCFASEGMARDYGTLVLVRKPLSSLPADEYQRLDEALLENFQTPLDGFEQVNIEGCANENI